LAQAGTHLEKKAMSDLARQLIRENMEKYQRGEDARALDLGNCSESWEVY